MGHFEICAGTECNAVFSVTSGMVESRGFLFGLQEIEDDKS